MEVIKIGVPLKEGCSVEGADLGISNLKEIKFDKVLEVLKQEENNNKLKNLNTVKKVVDELSDIVYDVLKNGEFPLTIGGDHSLAIGSLAGSSNYSDISILWIDSHADINSDISSITGNIHGCPLATSFGLGDEKLVSCFGNKINPSNIVIFGCSDLDKAEDDIIKKYNIKIFTHDYIVKKGIEIALDEAISYLKQTNNKVHISFDIDSMDPIIYCGVNVKSNYNKGFSSNDIKIILDKIFDELIIQSFDVVEYNPLTDNNDITKQQFIEIIRIVIDKINKMVI